MSKTPASEEPIRLALLGMNSGFHPKNWVLWTRLSQIYPWLPIPFPKAEVVAAATLGCSEQEIRDNAGSSAEEMAAEFEMKLYRDAEELLDRERPQGVFICGRPSTLPALALLCIERGIHVYLQKPAGVHAKELEGVVRAAKEKNVQAAAGATWRFDGAVMTSRDQLKQAEIGKLCSVRVMYNHGMPLEKTWYTDPKEGGPELWLGWYNIDLLHQFAGSTIRRLFATAHRGDGARGQAHTIIHASCIFENGMQGSMDLYGNIYYPYSRAEWELLGEQGMIRNVQRHDVEIYQKGKPQTAVYRNAFFDGLATDIAAWLNSWKTGTSQGMTLAEATEVVRVAAAISKSIRNGEAVDVSKA